MICPKCTMKMDFEELEKKGLVTNYYQGRFKCPRCGEINVQYESGLSLKKLEGGP